MSKRTQPPKTKQALLDFTTKISSTWELLTQPAKPVLPHAGGGKAELEALLGQLVSIPTVTGNYDANHDALDYIERFLKKRGMYVHRYEWNGLESLVATTRRTKTPEVMLAAHLDVVPGGESMFDLREEDGKYFGRGVLDMKFAIAAYLQVVDDLRAELHKHDFGIMITTDEEAGGLDGVAKVVEEGFIPKVCILPDGGLDWQMQLYSKGFLYLSLTTSGVSAHGARPWLGKNALDTLLETIKDIRTLFPDPGTDPDSIFNTCNIGKIRGGKAINQVAATAEALLDIRYTSDDEKKRLLRRMEDISKKHGATLNIVANGDITNYSLADPYLASFAKIITDVTGVKVVGSRTPASSDVRYFTPYGVPCISVYPPGSGHHGPEEWVDKQGVYQFREIITEYLRATAKRSA